MIHEDIIYLFKEVDDAAIWSFVFWDESPCDKVVNDTLKKWWNWLNVSCKETKTSRSSQSLASKPFTLSRVGQSDSLPAELFLSLVFSSLAWPKMGTPS